MTQNFYDCLKTLFGCVWSLLTSFHLPGTNITPAAMILFGALTYIALKFFTNMIGTGGVQESNAFISYNRYNSGSDRMEMYDRRHNPYHQYSGSSITSSSPTKSWVNRFR